METRTAKPHGPGLSDQIRAAFPRADPRSIERLLGSQLRHHARQGGDIGDDRLEVLLVLEGNVAFTQVAPDGRVSHIGAMGPGSVLGLTSLDGEPYPVRVEALDSVTVAAWPAETFRVVAASDPGLLFDVVEKLIYSTRVSLKLLERQTFAPARARLASFLLRNEDLISAPRPRLLRRQIASFAGVSREMVGRIIREWEREGIVKRAGTSGLAVIDRPRLEREAAVADEIAAQVPRLDAAS